MKQKSLFLLTSLICLSAPALRADMKHFEVMMEPGAGLLLGDPEISGLNNNVNGVDDGSAFFGAQVLWDRNERWGVGVDMNFLGDSSASRKLVSGAPTAWQTKSFVIMTVARYYLMDTRWAKPYALVGVGAHRTTLLADDGLIPVIDSSQWGFASALGMGLALCVRDPFIVAVEGRLQLLTTTHYSLLENGPGTTTATGGRARPSSFDVLLKMGLRF